MAQLPVDYDALAAQHGGAPVGVDYDALAAAHGGTAAAGDAGGGMTFAVVNGQRVPVDEETPLQIVGAAVKGAVDQVNPYPVLKSIWDDLAHEQEASAAAARAHDVAGTVG